MKSTPGLEENPTTEKLIEISKSMATTNDYVTKLRRFWGEYELPQKGGLGAALTHCPGCGVCLQRW